MNVRKLAPLIFLSLAPAAMAQRGPSGTLTYKPHKLATDGRPTATKIHLGTKGTDFVLTLEYDKAPYGADCKNRCARSTFLIDTDNDLDTGLQQGRGRAVSGADLLVLLEGFEGVADGKPAPFVKVTIKRFSEGDRLLDEADLVTTLDERASPQRLKLDGTKVTVTLDASSEAVPVGKASRIVYLAPGVSPLTAQAVGLTRKPAAVRAEKGKTKPAR